MAVFAHAWPLVGQTSEFAAQFNRASHYHELNDYAHSIPILKELVRKNSRSYECNLLLGEDLLRAGDTESALAPLRAAAELHPAVGTAFTLLADAAIRGGDYSAAAEALQSAISGEPRSEAILLKWADLALDRTHDLAIAMRKTKRGEAAMLRVTAASRAEDDPVRETLLKESADKDPAQRGIWGELGTTQVALGKRTEAVETLKEAVRKEPEESLTLELEALLAAFDQRWADAETRLSAVGRRSPAELERALSLWPSYLLPEPDIRGQVWDCLRRKSEPCRWPATEQQDLGTIRAEELYAEGKWEQVVARTPATSIPTVQVSLWRGVALAKTGDCGRGIPALERALSIDSLVAGYWLEICYANAGQAIMATFARMGDNAALHELRGDLSLRIANDGAKAQWDYAEALKSKPRDAQLLTKLAEAYDRMGYTAQARAAALSALDIDPRQSTSLRLLALIAMDERDYAEAIRRLRTLTALEPADDWVRVQLGVACGQAGNPAEAIRYLAPELQAGYSDPKGTLHAMASSALRKLGRDHDAQIYAAEASHLAQSALKNESGSDLSNQQ